MKIGLDFDGVISDCGQLKSNAAKMLYGLDIPACDFKKEIIIGVGHGVSKAGACAGLDVFVDDDLDKLEQLVGVVPRRFLFSWGYNKHLAEGTTAKRVGSWQEFCEEIASTLHSPHSPRD